MKQKEPKDSLMLSLLIFLAQVVGMSMLIINVALITLTPAPKPAPLSQEESKPYEDIAKELVAPMVSQAFSLDGTKMTGTAFALSVGDQVVTITNRHVCLNMSDPETPSSIKGKRVQLDTDFETVIAISTTHDLCMLTSNRPLGLIIAPTAPYLLDIIFTVGHPSGGPKQIKTGRVYVLADDGYTTMKTYGGESGSPVLNTKGEVVGVIWGRATDYEDIGIFVRWGDLKDFVMQELYGMQPQYRK